MSSVQQQLHNKIMNTSQPRHSSPLHRRASSLPYQTIYWSRLSKPNRLNPFITTPRHPVVGRQRVPPSNEATPAVGRTSDGAGARRQHRRSNVTLIKFCLIKNLCKYRFNYFLCIVCFLPLPCARACPSRPHFVLVVVDIEQDFILLCGISDCMFHFFGLSMC